MAILKNMLSLSKIYNFIYSNYQGFVGVLSHLLGFLSIKIYLSLSLVLNIVAWVLTILFRRQLTQSLIILHFNVDFGVDLIGDAGRIFIMPAIGLAIILVNFLILLLFSKSDHFNFLMHLLLASAVLANLFLLIALGPIYYINFR